MPYFPFTLQNLSESSFVSAFSWKHMTKVALSSSCKNNAFAMHINYNSNFFFSSFVINYSGNDFLIGILLCLKLWEEVEAKEWELLHHQRNLMLPLSQPGESPSNLLTMITCWWRNLSTLQGILDLLEVFRLHIYCGSNSFEFLISVFISSCFSCWVVSLISFL